MPPMPGRPPSQEAGLSHGKSPVPLSRVGRVEGLSEELSELHADNKKAPKQTNNIEKILLI